MRKPTPWFALGLVGTGFASVAQACGPLFSPAPETVWKGGTELTLGFHADESTVTGIASDRAGDVFVTDFYDHRVPKIAPDGTFPASFGSAGGGPGDFKHPLAVVVASDGAVHVAYFGNNRVQPWRPRISP